jgi:DNA-binding transcriptional LysR family regulator
MRHQSGDDIGVFLMVCEAGSFVAASLRLRLSASAVAKAIGRLESRLGIRLFQRTTRVLNLTAEGVVYRDVCLRARSEIVRAEVAIAGLAHEPAGMLHVSLPRLFGAKIVAPALYALCREWPNLDFSISTSTEPSNLLDGTTDLAVRIGEIPDVSGLTARSLGLQQIVLCGSPSYFETRTMPQSVADLDDHDVIAAPRQGKPAPWQFRSLDGEMVNWHPKARLVLDGCLLTHSAICDGQGLGLLPRWLVRDELVSGRLVSLMDDRIAGHLPIHAIWPASPVMLPRVRVAIDAIVAVTRPLLKDGTLG